MKKLLFFFLISTFSFGQDYSFLGLEFGMTSEEILTHINNSKDLIPEDDVLLKQVFIPTPNILVLKANNSNNNMIQKIFIDFNENRSYQFTIFLDSKQFSFYTLLEKMLDNYGVPINQNSYKVVWENSEKTKRAILEYPAVIKFTDINILNMIINKQEHSTLSERDSVKIKERNRILNEL